jgi:hypothetical protein
MNFKLKALFLKVKLIFSNNCLNSFMVKFENK